MISDSESEESQLTVTESLLRAPPVSPTGLLLCIKNKEKLDTVERKMARAAARFEEAVKYSDFKLLTLMHQFRSLGHSPALY
jgi:hypothetical protein